MVVEEEEEEEEQQQGRRRRETGTGKGNALQHPLVTVIAKVGLDHQERLGAIAREKAGILKPGVEVVVDGSNAPEVLDEIRKVAQEVGAGRMVLARGLPRIARADKLRWSAAHGRPLFKRWGRFVKEMQASRGRRGNIACAYEAVPIAAAKMEARMPRCRADCSLSTLCRCSAERRQRASGGRSCSTARTTGTRPRSCAQVYTSYRLRGRRRNKSEDAKVVGFRETFTIGEPFTRGKDVVQLANTLANGFFRVLGSPRGDYFECDNLKARAATTDIWSALLDASPRDRQAAEVFERSKRLFQCPRDVRHHCHVFRLRIVLTEIAIGRRITFLTSDREIGSRIVMDWHGDQRLPPITVAGYVENEMDTAYGDAVYHCLSLLENRDMRQDSVLDDDFTR